MKQTRDNQFLISFGNRVREVRQAKELSQELLANKANLELSQINRIELGKINTSISQVSAIAEALEIHPKELFDFPIQNKKK